MNVLVISIQIFFYVYKVLFTIHADYVPRCTIMYVQYTWIFSNFYFNNYTLELCRYTHPSIYLKLFLS